MKLGEMDLASAAKAAAGNWREFDCFCWHRRPDDADQWAIIYTHNRDSGLLDQSNAHAIAEVLRPFPRNAVPENHHHWACGWVEGFSIRVFRRGRITRAFRTYHALAQRLADYPILDEQDYSSREYEATHKNLPDAAWKIKNEYELPGNWTGAVYDWFSEHDCSAIESSDDRGGYPTEEQLRTAFEALSYNEMELV
jgi:hypothetical protein